MGGRRAAIRQRCPAPSSLCAESIGCPHRAGAPLLCEDGKPFHRARRLPVFRVPLALSVAPASRRLLLRLKCAAMLTIRSRGRLPHWEATSATYFVTFRLADSLPQEVLAQIQRERSDIVAIAKAAGRELSSAEQKRLTKLSSEKIETRLDAGNGDLLLADPRVAGLVAEALAHFDGKRYRIFAWCVMPNHVHVVFQPVHGHTLPAILHSWKSYSAKMANRILNRSGEFWQHEYYDHLVRDEEDLRRVVRYVLENPQKAGLLEWRWVGMGKPVPKAK
jgi:REP element-mobilizing transposase RayT